MSIINRIAALERLVAMQVVDDNAPASIPAEWLETDPLTGEPAGPGPGETMTPAQQRTWATVRAMDLSVPYCPE